MDGMSLLLFALTMSVGVAIVCGSIGVYVATQKGRGEGEGFLFGFFLGPLGLILLALLPNKERARKDVQIRQYPADEDWQAIRDRMK